jgi:hypothetical protein
MREILAETMWGKVEYKNQEPMFKVVHPELEYEKKHLPEYDVELMNYKEFLDFKFQLKTPEEVPIEEDRNMFNEDLMYVTTLEI